MISKLRKKLILLFVTLTMLVFTMTQITMIYANIEDVWSNDLLRLNKVADRIVQECMDKGSIQNIDLSIYVELNHGQQYLIYLTNGQEKNTNADLWGDAGKVLEELVRTGQATGPDMSGGFDDWDGSIDIYPVVGNDQSRTYVVKAEFAEIKMTILSPSKSLWENILYFSKMYAKSWVITLAAVCFLSYFLVKKALQPVEASIHSQRNFITATSHELKAPLAVIQANTEAMESSPKQKIILDECSRMNSLIQSMLSLASSDAGNWKMDIRETNVDTLLIETWEAFSETARKKNIRLNLDIEESYPTIKCDKERISQVLGIFLDNAISYSPSGTAVQIGAKVQGKQLVFYVIDHGPGISDSEKEKVFERFYSGDPSRTEKGHYGLGLSIAQEIVKLHYGKIELKDTPGGGCTFEIHLQIEKASS